MPNLAVKNPAERFDLAYLYASGSKKSIEELAAVAREVVPGVSARCAMVHLADLEDLVMELGGSAVRPEIVIDFPDGLGGVDVKDTEARRGKELGAVAGDIVVNLRHVAARDKGKIIAECKTALRYMPEIKLIGQIPYLWQFDREAIDWLLDFLPEAGVYCVKDWTTRHNFLLPAGIKLDVETATRVAYTEHIANYIVQHNLPLLVKVAGGVDAGNARSFLDAGADLLGISYGKAAAIYGALNR